MEGISALHGGHQDAQKFIKTTLPFSTDVLWILPFESTNEKEEFSGKSLTASFFISALNKPTEINCRKTQALPLWLIIMKRRNEINI
jgi:hypothetical protein